ncbi:hypothetical protein [Desertihabitans aurantiacus]|uniref:hypothetical protein n=1 Tax=Desertihabitans aurantiacus TaxID=2282477 RepID=UPI000DF7E990|nr:hypothetical protein [Desertihabitans aurantiacus]
MRTHQVLRQLHRWMAVLFTVLAIVVTVIVLTQEVPATWVYLSPLVPLTVQWVTGLYLFAVPYRRRRDREPAATRS